ncbi:unnamed protein product [Cylicostephanus goldi]|uniref:Uncharacterized protein n=1 Tax=Cylicostephanus goldi TaxID=71465 RepID=A0A3P7M7S7_CYLGO|nr:unnamed protein product [Cylicostephanus goldi]
MQEQALRLGVELAMVVIILTARTEAEVGTADFLDD